MPGPPCGKLFPAPTKCLRGRGNVMRIQNGKKQKARPKGVNIKMHRILSVVAILAGGLDSSLKCTPWKWRRYEFIAKVSLERRALAWVLFTTPVRNCFGLGH